MYPRPSPSQPAFSATGVLGKEAYFGTSVTSLGLSGDCSVWCSLTLAAGTDMEGWAGTGGVLVFTIQPPSPPSLPPVPPAAPPPATPPPSPPPPAVNRDVDAQGDLTAALLSATPRVALRVDLAGVHHIDTATFTHGDASPSELIVESGLGATLVAQAPGGLLFNLSAPNLLVTLQGLHLVGFVRFAAVGGVLRSINCSFEPLASSNPDARAALQVSAGRAYLERVSFEAHDAGALLVDGGNVTVVDAVLARNRAARGAAALVTSGILNLLNSVIELNEASAAGGALAVDGGAVVLANQTVLRGNTAPSGALAVVAQGASLHYGLPAPPSRWVIAPFECKPYRVPCGADASTCDPASQPLLRDQPCNWQVNPVALGLTMASLGVGAHNDAIYPLACPASTYGDSLDVAAQSQPTCSGVCPEGAYCGVGTVVPAVCTKGSYCPLASAAPLPCPAGSFASVAGLAAASGCSPCRNGTFCPVASEVETPCAAGTYSDEAQQATCKSCPTGAYQDASGETACKSCSDLANCAVGQYRAGCAATSPGSCTPCSAQAGRYFTSHGGLSDSCATSACADLLVWPPVAASLS